MVKSIVETETGAGNGQLAVIYMPSGNVFLGLQDWNDSNVCILRNPKTGQSKKCVSVGGALAAGANSFVLQGTKTAVAATDLDVYMMAAEDAVFVDISNSDLTRVSNQLANCGGYSLPVYDFASDSATTRIETCFDYIATRSNLQNYEFKWFAEGQHIGAKVLPVLVSQNGELRMVYRDGAYFFTFGSCNKGTKRGMITASTAPESDWIMETIAEMGGALTEVSTTLEEDSYIKRLQVHTLNAQIDYWQSTYMWTWEDYMQNLAEDEAITLPSNFVPSQATLQLPYTQGNKSQILLRRLWFSEGTKTYMANDNPQKVLCVGGQYINLVGAVPTRFWALDSAEYDGPVNSYEGIDVLGDDGTIEAFAALLNYWMPTLEGFEVS